MFEPDARQIVEVVTAGPPSQAISRVVAVPTLLVRQPWIQPYTRDNPPIAQAVLDWLVHKGLQGDRTRMNLAGYPGVFRKLLVPPPWVEVEPEDCEGEVTPERAADLLPAYEQLISDPSAAAKLKRHLSARRNALSRFLPPGSSLALELLDELQGKELERLIRLAQILGPETTQQLPEAVFEDDPEYGFDDMTTSIGAPDLFMWTPSSLAPFWFFAEVKGPSDHLRASQAGWLASHWGMVRGHFVLILVADL